MTRYLVLCASLLGGVPPALAQEGVREEVKRAAPPKITRPPELRTFVPAVYPPLAQKNGVEGTVLLQIDLDARGKVGAVKVLTSVSPELDAAAVDAVRRFVFSPAELDGKPGPVRVRYAYRFALDRKWVPRLPEWMLDAKERERGRDVVVGRVREQGTRLPVEGAAVAVMEAGVEVKADERGRFVVRDLAPGTYRVQAISLEHKRETVQVVVRAGEQTRIDFYLPRLNVSEYETVVRGKRRQTTVSRVSLRREQLTTVPGTFGDPLRVIENLPGVARVPYVGGALLIRGAPPNDSGVYLDGHRIPILYHFLGGPSVLNSQFLDRIDYYPGNADARYNRLTAGVVDVATRNTFTRQWQGAADINLLNASLFLNVPISSKVSVAAAARRSYIDAILPVVLKATSRSATTVVPVYYDYQLRLDVDLAGDDQLYLLALGSDDALAIASNEPKENLAVSLDSKVTFHRLQGMWRKQLGPRWSSKLSPAFGFWMTNFSSGESSLDLKNLTWGLRWDLEGLVRKGIRLRVGADVEVTQSLFQAQIPVLVDYRNPGAPVSGGGAGGGGFLGGQTTGETQPVDVKAVIGGAALYLDAIVDLTDRLQIMPGLRFDTIYYFGNARLALDPRLTARYSLWRRTTLKAAVGLYSQAPSPAVTNEVTGNPNLQLEHAAHYSLGVEQGITANLSVNATGYYLDRYGQGIRSNQVRFENGQPKPLYYTNEGGGSSFGLELMVKHELTRHFYGWLAYTLSRSLAKRRADGEAVRFAFDQTHILTLVGSVRFGSGWEAGLRFRLVSGRPETPVLGGFFDADGGFYRQLFGVERSENRPLFHQLDLRIEKTWLFRLWRLSAYLDVQNVYNAENPEATMFDYRFRQSGNVRGLPILPTFGVKGSF
ncbi:MAG: TonB-dependent receptor [Deltaproteobacteria bacterium]|nr:TonB-dependent receptor [Deltaproteobacteria bacterium]